jgi:type III pantothenate kinase
MFLAIDIGNTSATFGLFKDDILTMTFNFPTANILANENIEQELLPKLAALGDLQSITISSVVSQAAIILKEIFQRVHPEAKVIILKNENIPIVNKYDFPSQVGSDRLLACLAAYHKWGKTEKKPLIVIDLGTATTIDCVNAEGEFLGGIIMLGIASSAKSLANVTAQLPEIELTFPPQILGRSTIQNIQSGILYGALASIEGLVIKLKKEVFPDQEIIVAATGGLSHLLEGRTSLIDHFEPHLVLEGVALTAQPMSNSQ